jgi:hypothetical protein
VRDILKNGVFEMWENKKNPGFEAEIELLDHHKTREFEPQFPLSCELMHCPVGSIHVKVRHHEDFGKKVRVNYFDISKHLSFLQKKKQVQICVFDRRLTKHQFSADGEAIEQTHEDSLKTKFAYFVCLLIQRGGTMIRRKRMLNLRYCLNLDDSKTTDSILFAQENLVEVALERR